MMMLNKKQKEQETFFRMVTMTSMAILVKKGICTEAEFEDAGKKVMRGLVEVAEQKGDYNMLIQKLQKEDF